MLTDELEFSLNDSFHWGRTVRHQYLTVEHLLLAILDTPKVREILRACGADLQKLKEELKQHIDQTTPRLAQSEETEVQPTLGFQRVLQRAVFHVQTSGRKNVDVASVLVAIFSEKQSQAVLLLNHQHVTRLDVVKYITQGPPAREAVSYTTVERGWQCRLCSQPRLDRRHEQEAIYNRIADEVVEEVRLRTSRKQN
jgi:ATP-dependent Clp protease ATP-binding subunit ClpA